MNNVCQADLKIYTPACLPPTGTSFVGKTGTVYGKFSILKIMYFTLSTYDSPNIGR